MAHVEHCIIVGVDYGTTYSGVSYAASGETVIDSIYKLQDWKGGIRDAKVPSKIAYVRNRKTGVVSTRWGYNIPPSATAYCWTKLLLDPLPGSTPGPEDEEAFDDQEIRRNVIGDGMLKLPPGKPAEQVVADYLAELYDFTIEYLKRNLEMVDLLPIHFVFTVPAQWSLRGVEATINAAKKAGFGSRKTRDGNDKLEIIREPEAAAIACIRYMSDRNVDGLSRVRPGANVLVCDCGGGTVDLVSYRIEAVTPKLILRQTCISKGGKCGSTSIDRAFYALMKREFGDAFTDLRYDLRGPGSVLMQEFERAKRDLGNSKWRDDIYLRFSELKDRLPEDYSGEHYDIERGEIVLTYEEMEDLFEPTLDMIKGLIDQQIKQTKAESGSEVDLLLLVGGFGRSPHLYQQILYWCHQNHPSLVPKDPAGGEPGVQTGVVSPPIGWEAISLGATIRGLQGALVTERKSRFHIGLDIFQEFVPGIHDGCDTFIYQWNGKKQAQGLTSWLVRRGDVVTPGMVLKSGSYCRIFTPGGSPRYTDDLWQSEAKTAPDRVSDRSVRKVGTFELDLSGVDVTQFEKSVNVLSKTRETIYRFSYHYELKLDDETGYMSVRTVCQGREIGKTTLKFENQY